MLQSKLADRNGSGKPRRSRTALALSPRLLDALAGLSPLRRPNRQCPETLHDGAALRGRRTALPRLELTSVQVTAPWAAFAVTASRTEATSATTTTAAGDALLHAWLGSTSHLLLLFLIRFYVIVVFVGVVFRS